MEQEQIRKLAEDALDLTRPSKTTPLQIRSKTINFKTRRDKKITYKKMRNYEKSVKMTCAENPPPSLLKQDGLCTQGLHCNNQS